MEKHSQEEAQPWRKCEGRRSEVEKMRKGESQKREDAGARKGRKVTKHCVFPLFCGSGGSKSRLAQAAGAEPAGQMKDEKFNGVARSTFTSQNVLSTSAWREARFEVKMYKAPQLRSTFGSCDVEEVHAIARHCGAKHMWKSKCTKHTMFGRLLEVERSKKCTPLWCKAHWQVKTVK